MEDPKIRQVTCHLAVRPCSDDGRCYHGCVLIPNGTLVACIIDRRTSEEIAAERAYRHELINLQCLMMDPL